MVLSQHVVLLDFVGCDSTHALYRSEIEVDRPQLKLLMPLHTYEDMEQPEQVTIAVRPGSAFTDLDVAFLTPPADSTT